MGIFDIFKEATKRYISESTHEDNMEVQLAKTPQILEELYKTGVTEKSELKLEYLFYTNAEDNAKRLMDSLKNIGYTPEHRLAPDSETTWLVTGLSHPVKMTKDKTYQWIGDMCILGFKEDCQFDGWTAKTGE